MEKTEFQGGMTTESFSRTTAIDFVLIQINSIQVQSAIILSLCAASCD